MKIALAQLVPTSDPEHNSARVRETVSEHPDADLILFPELFIGGYASTGLDSRSVSVDGPEMRSIGDACRTNRTAVLVGFTEAMDSPAGAFANSAACFDTDGSLAGVYRKTHLFGPAEQEAYEAGDSMLLVTLGGQAIGPQICFDVEFPEPSRQMALAGARLLATLSANMEPYAADHRLAARARSLDNRLPHLYVNRTGSESGFDFVGESCVTSADGTVLAELGRDEGVLEIDLFDLAEHDDANTEYLRQVRHEIHVSVQENPNRGER